MSKKNKMLFLITYWNIIIICPINSFAQNTADKIRFFPSESTYNEYDYSLGKSGSFDVLNNIIYFCSSSQHEVYIIDLNGKLLNRFGQNGQGPGEFNGPSRLRIMNEKIYVYDAGNARFEIYSINGHYERQIKILETVYNFKTYLKKIYIHPWIPPKTEQKIIKPILIYKDNGEREREFESMPFKPIEIERLNAGDILSIEIYNNLIHCLQLYGTNYRIYDLRGNLIKNIELGVNPISLPERKQLKGWRWAFNAFCIDNDLIYASCASRGNIIIYVFNMNGRFIKKYSFPQPSDDIYSCDEIKVISVNGKKYMLMLLRLPDCIFGTYELK